MKLKIPAEDYTDVTDGDNVGGGNRVVDIEVDKVADKVTDIVVVMEVEMPQNKKMKTNKMPETDGNI